KGDASMLRLLVYAEVFHAISIVTIFHMFFIITEGGRVCLRQQALTAKCGWRSGSLPWLAARRSAFPRTGFAGIKEIWSGEGLAAQPGSGSAGSPVHPAQHWSLRVAPRARQQAPLLQFQAQYARQRNQVAVM